MSGASELGNAINEKRLSLHYSIGQLATVVGVTASEVRSWENGEKLPDEAEIAKLSEALKLKKGELTKLVPAAAPPEDTSPLPDATAVVAASPKTTSKPERPPKTEEPVEAAGEPAVDDPADAEESPVRARVAPPQPVVSKQKTETSEAVPEGAGDAEEPHAESAPAVDETAPAVDDKAADGDAPDESADDVDAPAEVAPVAITDLPTERIPIITDAPPPPERQQVPSPVAVATPPPPRRASTAAATETPLTPWRQTMEAIFDRDKPWLFWIRTGLLLISMLILLRVLAWAVPEFFGTLGEILDTIQSTNPDPELNDPIPISP